jgi:hypothetical protein
MSGTAVHEGTKCCYLAHQRRYPALLKTQEKWCCSLSFFIRVIFHIFKNNVVSAIFSHRQTWTESNNTKTLFNSRGSKQIYAKHTIIRKAESATLHPVLWATSYYYSALKHHQVIYACFFFKKIYHSGNIAGTTGNNMSKLITHCLYGGFFRTGIDECYTWENNTYGNNE